MKRWLGVGVLCMVLLLCLGAAFRPLKSRTYLITTYAASGVATTQTNTTLLSVTGFNSGPGQFIMLFDSATVPADATAPDLIVIWAPADQNFSYDAITRGHRFSSGIAWSNSSTAETKTIAAADVVIQIEHQ